MLQIRGAAAMARALDQPLDTYLRALLAERAAQLGAEGLEDACIAVVEAGEGITDVAAAIGYPLTDQGEPTFDVALLHPGRWFEAVWSFGDSSAAVLIQDNGDAHATLIRLFREHAVDAPASEAARKAG